MALIKQQPEDFIVEEITNVKQGKGDYCYFWLKKKNYTTMDAVRRVGRLLGVKKVGFAGTKDKKAVTRQLCSAYGVTKQMVERAKLKDIELDFFGYGDVPISLGDLEGNKFVIIVRDVYAKQLNNFKSKIKNKKVVNYFDEQRFSEYNVEIGKAIVTRDFKKAVELICKGKGDYNKAAFDYIGKNKNYVVALQMLPKKILTLFVHAYQSWLWNETVRILVGGGSEVKYSQGIFVFPNKKIRNMKIPLLGFGTEIEENKIKIIITTLLKKEEITLRDFIIRQLPEVSVDGSERDMVIDVKDMKYWIDGDRVKLSFFLPKGSYATIVVKSLFEAK